MRRQNPKKRIQRAKYWVLTFNLNIQATKRWIQAAFEQQKQFPSRNQFPSPFHVRYQGFEKNCFFLEAQSIPPTPATPIRMPALPFQPLTTQVSICANCPMQI